MNKKTKIIILLSFIILTAIGVISVRYMLNNSESLEIKSGKYYCKLNIIDEGNTNAFIWDVGISKNNIKRNINENQANKRFLEKFMDTVSDMNRTKSTLIILILYAIFVLTVLICAKRDTKMFRSEENKKLSLLVMKFIIIFLIYKVAISSASLYRSYVDINYYYNIISRS